MDSSGRIPTNRLRGSSTKNIMKLINFSKSVIDEICKKAPDVSTAFLGFYRIAVPEFDNVKQIDGFPVVSDKTAIYCIDQLMAISKEPYDVNMLWLNKGFSSDKSIPEWKISVENVKLIF
jgi:hypothetical protein